MKQLKRYLISYLFVSLGIGLSAAPWGGMSDYDAPRPRAAATKSQNTAGTESTRISNQSQRGEKYLLKQILDGRPVKVYLANEEPQFSGSLFGKGEAFEEQDSFSEEVNQSKELSLYQKLVEKMYKSWFSYTASVIRRKNRQKEFKDVLPILDKSVEVVFVADFTEADIAIYIVDFPIMQKHCPSAALGCYSPKEENGIPVIWLPKDTKFTVKLRSINIETLPIGIHEVGHSLGLSDQYAQSADNNSHPVYSSTYNERGIMNSGPSKMSCDDADGFINLIDITNNVYSERNEYGWRSLCLKSNDIYSYGIPASRGPYAWHGSDMNNGIYLTTYQKQTSSSQFFPWVKELPFSPFHPLKETPQAYDKHNRVIRAQGSYGEDIYYIYQYKAKTRVVTWNKEVVFVERTYPKYILHQTRWMDYVDHSMLFKRDEKMVSVDAHYDRLKGGMANYMEGKRFLDPNPSRALILFFDENKNIVDVVDNEVIASQRTVALESSDVAKAGKNLSSVEYAVTHQAQKQQQTELKTDIATWFRSKY